MTLRVLHVITGLGVGGAEKSLLAVASHGRDSGIEPSVVCLGNPGPVSKMLEDQGIHLEHLGLSSVWTFPLAIRRLRRIVVEQRPDVVQGWMYHGNLAAYFAAFGRKVAVAWNIRTSLHRADMFKLTTKLTVAANARLSASVQSIVYNSAVSRQQHERRGFSEKAGVVIANGVDLDRFTPKSGDKTRLRSEYEIDVQSAVLIAVGRFHPVKGHEFLLRAYKESLNQFGNSKLLVVGRGASWSTTPFARYADDAEMRSRVELMGERDDIAELLAASDIFVSASLTEGFPNAVAEAMASGMPCVATDVGDTRILIDDCGIVAPAGNTAALSAAIVKMLQAGPAGWAKYGQIGRERIDAQYSINRSSQMYVNHYSDLTSRLRAN